MNRPQFTSGFEFGPALTALQIGFAALFGAIASADTLTTRDGSRLVGKIERMADGKFVMVTDVVGTVEIDIAKVTSISTDEPVNVEMKSGDRLVGVVAEVLTEEASVVRSAIGEIKIPQQNIASVWRIGTESPAEQKLLAAHKPKWKTVVEIGGSATEGNTDSVDVRGRLELSRKTSKDLLRFYASADYGERDDARVRNEYRGGSSYEYLFTKRMFGYARGELEHDEFENLNLRATAAVGLGYYLIKKDEHELKVRAGPGYRHETYDSGRTSDDPIADLGLDYRLDVSKSMQFVHAATYAPNLEDIGDYRLDFDTALLFPLKADAWKLKVGMKNAYNSNPSGNLDRLDNFYYAGVQLELIR